MKSLENNSNLLKLKKLLQDNSDNGKPHRHRHIPGELKKKSVDLNAGIDFPSEWMDDGDKDLKG